MVADVAVPRLLPAGAAAAAAAMVPRHRDVLARLETGAIGARQPDGSVSVRRSESAGCFLYGPYLHLPKGRYRLTFRCRCGRPRLTAQPLIGIEIIVLSRFQQQWRDFTAIELRDGSGSLDFDVSDEHSLESENEGRFEFRFFHLGNADLTISAVELDALAPDELRRTSATASRWRLLGRLHKSWLGRRGDDGSVRVRQYELAGRVLYGGWPYLRLPRGNYRLLLRGGCRSPSVPDHPVLGVEVLGQSRWLSRRGPMHLARLPETNGEQLAWRDVTAEELAAGVVAVDLAVPTEMSMEAGADAPFDIRLYHFGTAALTIAAVDLIKLDDDDDGAAPAARWRLLGRLAKGRIGRQDRDGIAVGRDEPPGRLLFDRRASLQLPAGRYRLSIAGEVCDAGDAQQKLLQVTLTARSPLDGMARAGLRPLLRPRGIAGGSVSAAELHSGPASLEFEVPAALALGHGNWRFALRIDRLGNAAFRLAAVDICRTRDDGSADRLDLAAASPTRAYRAGRHKIVIIGNCQSETLRQGFARSETLSKLFDVKYHFVQLPKNLHEFAARDLETCDILLIQDIRLWDEFPLRDHVRPGADTMRFPLVRFASLWPFDAWNGPGDKEAYEREAPNLTFPYLDGLLGRIRKDIPDREARFRAYRLLEMPGIVNYRRLHEMEVRRLASMDQKFGVAIGGFILENFQSRRVFHTTVRPNWEVFSRLMQFVATQVGVKASISLGESIDASLRNPQVPIHPKVARELGVRWADETTRYLNRGVEVTWETYIRGYIEHHG
jgi:hypothetical protein